MNKLKNFWPYDRIKIKQHVDLNGDGQQENIIFTGSYNKQFTYKLNVKDKKGKLLGETELTRDARPAFDLSNTKPMLKVLDIDRQTKLIALSTYFHHGRDCHESADGFVELFRLGPGNGIDKVYETSFPAFQDSPGGGGKSATLAIQAENRDLDPENEVIITITTTEQLIMPTPADQKRPVKVIEEQIHLDYRGVRLREIGRQKINLDQAKGLH